MTLKDLKQGMVCELRNKEEIMVVNNEIYVKRFTVLSFGIHYNNDLTHKTDKDYDIMKITYGDKVVFERRNESRWFVPEFEEEYFFVDNSGDIRIFDNSKATLNYEIFNNTRVFKTRKEAEKRLKQQATLSVERWIAENDVEVDLHDTNVFKFYLCYDVDTENFIVFPTIYHFSTPKQFILSSKEKAEQLIKEREKELKIMFGVEE